MWLNVNFLAPYDQVWPVEPIATVELQEYDNALLGLIELFLSLPNNTYGAKVKQHP